MNVEGGPLIICCEMNGEWNNKSAKAPENIMKPANLLFAEWLIEFFSVV